MIIARLSAHNCTVAHFFFIPFIIQMNVIAKINNHWCCLVFGSCAVMAPALFSVRALSQIPSNNVNDENLSKHRHESKQARNLRVTIKNLSVHNSKGEPQETGHVSTVSDIFKLNC